MEVITPKLFLSVLKPRPKRSFKHQYGHVFTIASSLNCLGAGLLAARSALRSGAGLSTLALPYCAYQKIDPQFSEVMFSPQKDEGNTFSQEALPSLIKAAQKKSVIAIGPGIGLSEDNEILVENLVQKMNGSMILDADALTLIAKHLNLLKTRKGKTILTPHPGEMSTLLHQKKSEWYAQREKVVQKFCRLFQVYVVLKGYRSIVGFPNGSLYQNSTGNPGMATAGAGDVLTGVLAGLIAQKIPFEKALLLAVWAHGRAGDILVEEKGERGILAFDLAEKIPYVLHEIFKESK